MSSALPWQEADEGEVHTRVFEYVSEVERVQVDLFDRFVKLAALYDPNSATALTDTREMRSVTGRTELVSENVVAANIDTVHAAIAATEVRARVMTDDADWSTQRRARHLEWYAEAAAKKFEIHDVCRTAFKAAALKGTGVVHVAVNQFGALCVEPVMIDDLIVDEAEARCRAPRQMHRRVFVDRDLLRAAFPEHEEAIEAAQRNDSRQSWREWADYRPIAKNELVVIESWYLPIGVKGEDGYRAGRHTITVHGADLFDEEWEKEHFPFAVIRWSEKPHGWYGIGLAERIAGHQRALNKLNWQIDRQLDQLAVPTTYVRLADAKLAIATTNRVGTIVPIKGDMPQTVLPPAVSGETYQRRNDIKNSAFEESGVSRMAAQSTKPAGLDSGVALREYRDQTTQRFSQQEKAFERLYLDVIWLLLDCCKDMGASAPTFNRRTRQGYRKIEWREVDPCEVKVQLYAASNIARTPAGRLQLALEWAQAGVISQDEARRLMRHPDTERSMSLYTAAMENVEHCLEEIKYAGAVLTPEPFQNARMIVWRGQQEYLLSLDDGTPEEELENLRQFVVQAAYIVAESEAPQPTAPAMPVDPMAAAPAGVPPMPMGDMGPTMTGAGVAPANLI